MAASKEPEVHAIAEAHRAAQARLGIAGAYLSIAEWGSVNTLNASASGASWVVRALRMIFAIRKKSTRLAVAYIRLTRALETGYTLGYPEFSDDPKEMTMGVLREQFRGLLLEIADMDHTATDTTDEDERWFESELRRAELDPEPRQDRIHFPDTAIDEQIQGWLDVAGADDDAAIAIEDFDWGQDLTPEEVNKAFEDILNQDVVKAHEDKVKKLKRADGTPADAMDAIEKANDATASNGGGFVDQFGINAGREVIDHVFRGDRRVDAYARMCRPGACAFCTMMASRGFVYRSKHSAGVDGINSYHKNCHCYAILRYVDKPELPAQNAYWKAAYKREVTDKGYVNQSATSNSAGKNNALNAWRRWLNQQRRAELQRAKQSE